MGAQPVGNMKNDDREGTCVEGQFSPPGDCCKARASITAFLSSTGFSNQPVLQSLVSDKASMEARLEHGHSQLAS